jgi:hypothetical protein
MLPISLMMEAVRTSETLVKLCQSTKRYNPEDRHQYIIDLCIINNRMISKIPTYILFVRFNVL